MLNLSLNLLIPATVALSCAIFAIVNFLIAFRLALILLIFSRLNENFYFRKRFAITVNCWFCNTNTRVPYEQRNAFNCPSCSQYNGFNEDGSYNREMPEQHYSKLNASKKGFCQKTESRLPQVNGLCEPCNRNQEMKVIQLANFKPRNEAEYDEEIEDYRQKLEDSYQLCQKCQHHVLKTLNRVKTKFIGSKLTQLMSKGVPIVAAVKKVKRDRQILGKLTVLTILVFSVANLVKDMNINVRSITSAKMHNIYFHIVALYLTIVDLLKSWLTELDLSQLVDFNADALATLAVILNITIVFSQKRLQKQIIASLLLWSLKMVLSEIHIDPSYVLAVKGSIATALVVLSATMLFKSLKSEEPVAEQNSSFHKMHIDLAEDSEPENELESSSQGTPTISGYSPSVTSSRFSPRNVNSTIIGPGLLNSSHRPTQNRTFVRNEPILDYFGNQSFSIRQEVAAADRNQVHKDITKLNISGLGSSSTLRDFSLNKTQNPFSLENSRCGSPTPSLASVFSGASRAHVISPPRLETTFSAETATSWVGGGYWSSPQKRFFESQSSHKNNEMSRSSSQSSGLGTIDSDKNSRENSIIHDDFTSSIFSEPVRRRNLFGGGPSTDTRSLFSNSFAPAPRANFFTANNSFSNYRDSTSSFFK